MLDFAQRPRRTGRADLGVAVGERSARARERPQALDFTERPRRLPTNLAVGVGRSGSRPSTASSDSISPSAQTAFSRTAASVSPSAATRPATAEGSSISPSAHATRARTVGSLSCNAFNSGSTAASAFNLAQRPGAAIAHLGMRIREPAAERVNHRAGARRSDRLHRGPPQRICGSSSRCGRAIAGALAPPGSRCRRALPPPLEPAMSPSSFAPRDWPATSAAATGSSRTAIPARHIVAQHRQQNRNRAGGLGVPPSELACRFGTHFGSANTADRRANGSDREPPGPVPAAASVERWRWNRTT